ncbi:MAG: histidinol-phosphatase, partial [Flavobacteriaceae bacterium]|nr:histidinol-phosphatase [Flavobacteriaceae bacterium]
MKKVLFIDRDGTLIRETPDEQIDSFEKLLFYPDVLFYMSKIVKELDFELVMITNQDGLGTDVFPEETFWPTHNFIIKTFENEGVVFNNQFIDKSFAKDNSPNRKPNTGLLTAYFSNEYDLQNSYVIGDRLTDMELAKNLNAKGIYINDYTNLGNNEITVERKTLNRHISLETNSWKEIYEFLKMPIRFAEISRKTNETDINIKL